MIREGLRAGRSRKRRRGLAPPITGKLLLSRGGGTWGLLQLLLAHDRQK